MTKEERELIVEWMECVEEWMGAVSPYFSETIKIKARMKQITAQLCDPRTPGVRTTGRPIDDGDVEGGRTMSQMW